jgi:hypothetical protein
MRIWAPLLLATVWLIAHGCSSTSTNSTATGGDSGAPDASSGGTPSGGSGGVSGAFEGGLPDSAEDASVEGGETCPPNVSCPLAPPGTAATCTCANRVCKYWLCGSGSYGVFKCDQVGSNWQSNYPNCPKTSCNGAECGADKVCVKTTHDGSFTEQCMDDPCPFKTLSCGCGSTVCANPTKCADAYGGWVFCT